VIGTPRYMSPEQVRGKDVDHRADIYTLGVMTYELLSGRVPFERGNTFELLMAHVNEPVPALHPLAPDAPLEIAQLVEAMLAKSPDGRPTLDAIRRVIKRVRQSLPGGLDRTDPPLTSPTSRADLEPTRLDKPVGSHDRSHGFEDTGAPTQIVAERYQPPAPAPPPPQPLTPAEPSIDPHAPTTPTHYHPLPYPPPVPARVSAPAAIWRDQPRWLLIALVAFALTAIGIVLALAL